MNPEQKAKAYDLIVERGKLIERANVINKELAELEKETEEKVEEVKEEEKVEKVPVETEETPAE